VQFKLITDLRRHRQNSPRRRIWRETTKR